MSYRNKIYVSIVRARKYPVTLFALKYLIPLVSRKISVQFANVHKQMLGVFYISNCSCLAYKCFLKPFYHASRLDLSLIILTIKISPPLCPFQMNVCPTFLCNEVKLPCDCKIKYTVSDVDISIKFSNHYLGQDIQEWTK